MTEMGLVFANRTQTATQYSISTYGHKYAHPCNWQNAQYVAFYRWSWRLKGRKSTSRCAKCSNTISVQLTCYTINNILLTDTFSAFSPNFFTLLEPSVPLVLLQYIKSLTVSVLHNTVCYKQMLALLQRVCIVRMAIFLTTSRHLI